MADVQLSEEALQFIEEAKKNINKVEPVNSGLITNPDEEDFNFWNKAGSLTLSAAQGVVNAVEEQGDFLDENIVSAYVNLPDKKTVFVSPLLIICSLIVANALSHEDFTSFSFDFK